MAFATATADLQYFEKMYALTKMQANAARVSINGPLVRSKMAICRVT